MSAKELDRKYGPKGSKRIRTRPSQLEAVETLDDMRSVPGRCHELTGDLAGCLAVDLDHPYQSVGRLILSLGNRMGAWIGAPSRASSSLLSGITTRRAEYRNEHDERFRSRLRHATWIYA